MLNYKEAVNSICVDEDVSFPLNTDQVDCGYSFFCDSHHKRMITGDLQIIKNNKLKNF